MRDIVYMSCVLLLFVLLAAEFPDLSRCGRSAAAGSASFASFVVLPSDVYAACLESARTSWQVGSGVKPRASIGSLDAGIPLLADFLPPPEEPRFADVGMGGSPLGAAEIETYSLRPASLGRDMPEFAQRSAAGGAAPASGGFSLEEMLSFGNMGQMKEKSK